MREQHLDLLAQAARDAALPGPCDLAGHIASALMDRAWDLTNEVIRAAASFQCTAGTIALAGSVEHRRAIVDQRSGRGQGLAARTDVDVAGMIVGEVLPREGPVFAG